MKKPKEGDRIKYEQILEQLRDLSEKKIDSEKFGEKFQIDGMPAWWFLWSFVNSSFLPRPFKSLLEIEEEINNKKNPTSLEKINFEFREFFMRRALAANEIIKFYISKRGGRKIETGEKDVLFLAVTDKINLKDGKIEYVEFEKIISELKNENVKCLVLTGDPFSKNSLFKLNKYESLIYDYITPDILKMSKKITKELREKWKDLDEKSKIDLFTFNGNSYWKYFENDINYLFSKEVLYTLTKYYLTMKDIIENRKIKVVYLTSFTNFYDLSLLGAAHELDKKVVYSSHGYTRGTPGKWKFMKNVIFAAGGDENVKDLVIRDVKRNQIVITGYPFLDEIAKHRGKPPQKTKKTVALLTTIAVESKFIERDEYFKMIREVLEQLKKVEEIDKVVIKLHPKEKYRSEYESAAKSVGLENVEIVQKGPLHRILRESDLLIGFGTTAVLEGLMMGKDAIHLEMLETRPVFEFTEATLRVKKLDELAGTVKKIIADKKSRTQLNEKRERYLKKAFYRIDGRAYERVAKLIKSFVK